MKILIMNSNPEVEKSQFNAKLSLIEKKLRSSSYEVETLHLKDFDIGDCIGCYACWLKTPGLCSLKDDMDKVLSAYVKADYVIHATPVKMGFISPICKRIRDRMLPVVHPYLKMKEDRMTHVRRYDKLPEQLLVLDKTERIDFIRELYGNKEDPQNVIFHIEETEAIVNAITHH